MALTLQEIIDQLEKTAAPVESAVEPTTQNTEIVSVDEDAEFRKIAEEYDAAGRIMARAFADEMNKIAVGVTGITPNTAAVPDNPAVQLSNEDVNLPEVAQVVNTIREQTQGAEAKMTPAGQVQVEPKVTTGAGPSEQKPVAADMRSAQEDAAAAKTAQVVERLWNHYFGQN